MGDLFYVDEPEYTGDLPVSPFESAIRPGDLPKFNLQPPQQPKPQGGLLSNALTAGFHETLGGLGSTYSAAQASGANEQAANAGAAFRREQLNEAQKSYIPEYEATPGDPNFRWSNLPQQALYQAAKNSWNIIPGVLAGGAVGSMAGPLGTVAGGILGGAAAALPTSLGARYGETLDQNGDKMDIAAARQSLAWGVPHALLEGAPDAKVAGIIGKAFSGVAEQGLKKAAKSVLVDTASTALTEGATEGAQRVIELTARPDMTVGQKANSVIQNAFLGALAGGGTGGITSAASNTASQILRASRQVSPDQTSNDDLKATTAAAAPTQGDQQRAAEAQQAQAAQAQQVPPAQPVQEPQVQGEVSFAPPAQQAPAAEANYSPTRPLQGHPEEYLNQVYEAAQRAGDQGAMDIVDRERAARADDTQTMDAERQRLVEQEQTFRNNQARKEMLNKAGFKSNERSGILTQFNYLDDTVLADQVSEELKRENPSPSVVKLASHLGLLDEDGNQHDLGARMDMAHRELENAKTDQQRYKITKHLETLSRQFDLQQRMADREQPAPTQPDAQRQVHDAAAQYIESEGLSKSEAEKFLNGVQRQLDGKIEPVRKGLDKQGYVFAREQMPQQEQPSTPEAPTAEAPQALKPEAEAFLDSIKDVENPTVMMTASNRKIFQDAGVYDKNSTPQEMIQKLRAIREQSNAGVTNGESTNAAFGGNDVGYGRNEGSPTGPAVEGSVSFAPGEGRQAQPVREGQVGPAPGERQVGSEGQPVRESGQQGVWTGGGQAEKVVVSPEVRKLGNGKEVRKVTTSQGRTYYVPAESVSVVPPTSSTVAAMTDTTSSPSPAVDTSAPGVRPSAPGSRRESVASETPSAPRSAMETSRKVEDVLKGVTGSLTVDKIRRLVRQGVFYVASTDHIQEEWGDYVPEVNDVVEASKLGESVRMRSAATQMPVFEDYDRLSPKLQEHLQNILNAEAELQIKPLAKSWYDEHAHIIENPDLTTAQKADLKKAWDKLYDAKRAVLSSPEAKRVYQAFRDLNDASMHEWNAVGLLKMLEKMAVPGLPEPHIDFQMKEDITDTPDSVMTFWQDEKNKAVTAAREYLARLDAAITDPRTEDAERKKSERFRDRLEKRIGEIIAMEERAKVVPYSHLGRFGNEVVSFHFPTITQEGKEVVDPAALRRVAAAFDASDLDVKVNPSSTQKYAYMRFESIDDRNKAAEIVRRLQAQGAIKSDPKTFYAGPRDNSFELSVMSPSERAVLEAILEDVSENNEAFKGMDDDNAVGAAREQLEQLLRNVIIDSLPDSSVRKVMVSRKRITGANEDMIRSAAHRFEVNNVAIASMISGPRALKALRAIKQKSKDAGSDQLETRLTADDATFYKQLHHELAMRHLQGGMLAAGNNVTEIIKALTFTGAMGLNVSTSLLQGLSVATLGLPRLGAHAGVGMVRAGRALAKAMSPAARILAATLSNAISTDPKKIGDVVITPAILKKAGFNPEAKDAKFIMRVINSGIIEMGTLARDLGAIVSNKQSGNISKMNTMLRWANAMNQYMEVGSRLTMAFASLDVHNSEKHGDLYEFTRKNITNSLFDFSNNNQGRLFNRAANPVARLSTQFMSYPAMWTQLLVREGEKSIWGKDAQTKSEARNFLGMHFGMMAALAGVSGLPVFAPLAMALNGMFGSDDEPYDFENEVRKYLTLWFGKDVGDIAMRGLPRAFNTDISNRIGGQDLMPFSQFLADQRNYKDATQALIGRGLGAPASVLLNMLGGLDKIHNGEIWEGMKDLLPRGVHNMMEASDLAGGAPYRDTKGHTIPGKPGALAPVLKGVGFKSGTEADWSQVRQVNDSYEKQLQKVTAPIISGFTKAAARGNAEDMRYYLAKASDFAKKHPEFGIHKKMVSAMKGELKASAMEQATHLPRAVNKRDPQLLDALSWINSR